MPISDISALSPRGAVPPAAPIRLDGGHLARLLPAAGGWCDNALPLPGGSAAFRTGRIGPGIVATRSECRTGADFRTAVEHQAGTAILGFGVSGTSLFGVDGETPRHAVRPGDVWLFRLNDLAMARHTPVQPLATMLAVKFDTRRLEGLFDEDGTALVPGGTRAVRLGRAEPGCAGVRALLGNPLGSPLDRLMAESQALGLLARWLAPLPPPPDGHGALAPEERRGVARALDMLVSDLCEPPSLEDLARQAGMSHTRLNRCFRKAYGKTVFAWLRDYRLDVARRRLEVERHSVTEVAFLCGFSSSSHFAAAFRQRFGCQPGAIRQRQA